MSHVCVDAGVLLHCADADCSDGLDNDGDGFADAEDPACSSATRHVEKSPVLVCDDGLDNDGDGRVDLDDVGCDDPLDASEQTAALPCDHGLDNDNDGLVDVAGDPGCANALGIEDPACDDDWDNDADGGIDWDGGSGGAEPDPECGGVAWRTRESGGRSRCGLGLELVLLVAPLAWWRRRRAGRSD